MKLVEHILKACAPIATALSLLLFAVTFAAAESGPHHHKHAKHHASSHTDRSADSDDSSSRHSRAHTKRLAKLAHEKHIERLVAKHHAARIAKLEAAHKRSPEYRAHMRRLAKQEHLARLAANREAAKEAKAEHRLMARHMRSPAFRAHMKRLALLEERKQHQAKIEARRHDKRMAKLKAHAHNAHMVSVAAEKHATRLALIAAHREHQAQYEAQLAQAAAKHRKHEANLRAAHQARLAAHEARLAEQRAWAIEARDRQREQEAENRVSSAYGITQWGTYADGVPVQVVLVDLNKPQIKVSALLSEGGIGSSEPFSQMIERSHPKVAVTGTFFSLDNLRPVGDIVIDGNLAYFGGMGTALCITPGNHADMITVPWGHHHDWSGYDCVVACGPRLLKDGGVWLDPHAEKFKDRHMLAPNSRIAVGITKGNKLVFAMTRDRIYLGKLAIVMKELGCREAMNLDAGTSTGFYCNGHMIAQPGRRLTNAIVVHIKTPAEASEVSLPAPHHDIDPSEVHLAAEVH